MARTTFKRLKMSIFLYYSAKKAKNGLKSHFTY